MGNYNSQVVSDSEWKIEIVLNKGSTNISYVLKSDTPLMIKTVRGQGSTPITFTVDPKDFQMMHGLNPSGTDGEAEDLKRQIREMGVTLQKRFQILDKEDETALAEAHPTYS